MNSCPLIGRSFAFGCSHEHYVLADASVMQDDGDDDSAMFTVSVSITPSMPNMDKVAPLLKAVPIDPVDNVSSILLSQLFFLNFI